MKATCIAGGVAGTAACLLIGCIVGARPSRARVVRRVRTCAAPCVSME